MVAALGGEERTEGFPLLGLWDEGDEMWSFLFCVLLCLGYGDELSGKTNELRAVSEGRGRRKGKGWGGGATVASIGFAAPSSLLFMFLLSFRVSDNGHPSRVSCDCLLLFVHALRFIFIVQESHRVWETKFSLLWSLNLIKNQIRKRITIIILKIKIKW